MIPHRAGWDGLQPIIGDGSRAWDRMMPDAEHPRSHDPAQGWVATANQMNLPRDFDTPCHKPGFEWPDSSRFQVVTGSLNAEARWTIAETCRLQTSVLHLHARRLTNWLRALCFDGVAEQGRMLLVDWDHEMREDSAAAALFELWFLHHLYPDAAEMLHPGAFAMFAPDETSCLDTAGFMDRLDHDARLAAVREQLFATTMQAAWHDLAARLGPNSA